MPSYKKQIKGEKATKFLKTYKKLSAEMQEPILIEVCYKLLIEQMILINDVHASLQISKSYSAAQHNTKHPKTSNNITELTEILSNKALSDLEGIYNYNKNERIGIYYSENKKDLIAVVLETGLKQWDVGDIRFYATHTDGNKYNFYYYDIVTKIPGFVKSLTFENGRIWSYKKEGNALDYEFADNDGIFLIFSTKKSKSVLQSQVSDCAKIEIVPNKKSISIKNKFFIIKCYLCDLTF